MILQHYYWCFKNALPPRICEDILEYGKSLKDEKAAKSWLITILRRENARRFERKRFDMSEYEDLDSWAPAGSGDLIDGALLMLFGIIFLSRLRPRSS